MRLVRNLPLFALAGVALADDKPCTAHVDGKYYDLNNLKGR
jgi:cation-dependent mannose-6-phosphate receptor